MRKALERNTEKVASATIQLKFSDAVQDGFEQLYNLTDKVKLAKPAWLAGAPKCSSGPKPDAHVNFVQRPW
jgi:hypothetical protein